MSRPDEVSAAGWPVVGPPTRRQRWYYVGIIVLQVAAAGLALLGMSTVDSTAAPVMIPVWAVVAAGALVHPVELVRQNRIRRPAEAIGAVPRGLPSG